MSDFDVFPGVETEEELVEIENQIEEIIDAEFDISVEKQLEEIRDGEIESVDGLVPLFMMNVYSSEGGKLSELEDEDGLRLQIDMLWWDVDEWKRVEQPDWHKEGRETIREYKEKIIDNDLEEFPFDEVPEDLLKTQEITEEEAEMVSQTDNKTRQVTETKDGYKLITVNEDEIRETLDEMGKFEKPEFFAEGASL